MKKNEAGQKVGAHLVSATDGSDVTSGTTTVYVTIDAGTQATGTVGSGAATHEGNGYWTYAPSQGETNGGLLAFTFVNSSAVSQTVQIYTSYPQTGDTYGALPTNFSDLSITSSTGRVDVASIAGTSQTARDIGASVLLSPGTGTGQISLTSGAVTAGTVSDKTGYSLTATTGLGNQTANITGNLSGSVGSVTGGINTAAGTITTLDGLDSAQDSQHSTTQSLVTTVDTVVDRIEVDTQDLQTQIGTDGAGLTNIPWNSSWDTEVQSECNDALVAIHLDHLLATDYDPASKPGTSTALLNELVESDSGVSRFTVNALENGPSGSGASAASIADAVWDEALSGHTTAGSAGKALADIESDATAILADTNELQTNQGNWATATGFSTLDAAGVRTALGMASADLDDQLDAKATAAALTTVDGNVDAIKAKTDSLNFGVTGKVDANITHVNETEVGGDGASGTEWGPA